jgi:signal peptidase
MEPAFYRGDLLFLTNPVSERYHNGDITVYKIPGAEIPIVHRVLETHDFKSVFSFPRFSAVYLCFCLSEAHPHITSGY